MKENKFIREEELKFPVHSLREDLGLGVEIRKRWTLISGQSFSIFLKIKGNTKVFVEARKLLTSYDVPGIKV